MTELDPRSERAVAQLRASWEPPAGAEDRLLDRIHATVAGDGGPEGGGESSPPRAADSGGPSPGSSTVAKLAHAAKIVGATSGLTAIGLALLVVVGAQLETQDRDRADTDTDADADAATIADQRATTPSIDEPAPTELAPEARPRPPAPSGAKPDPAPAPSPKRSSAATSSSAALAAPPGPAGPTLEAELALMREARTAAAADALLALEAHAREFPRGTLARERDGLRIVALCELGRLADAQRHLDRFIAADARSLQLPRIREACPSLDFPPTDPDPAGDGLP